MDFTKYLLSLSLGDFKAVKKAVATLQRAGVDRETAINMIVEARRDRLSAGAQSAFPSIYDR